MVRVLLGYTWRLFREALTGVLTRESDLTVVAEAADSDEVLQQAKRSQPDVAVIDVNLPGPIDVHQLCLALGDVLPGCAVLVVLDTASISSRGGLALTRLTPRVGLLCTDASPTDLAEAVRQLAMGKVVLDPRIAVAALTTEDPLTEREREVLRLAVNGNPTKEIARTLHLSAGTVRNCLSRILTKTGARTRIEAIRVARESGWI
jgi:two-component system response regulator DesR